MLEKRECRNERRGSELKIFCLALKFYEDIWEKRMRNSKTTNASDVSFI